MGIRSRMRGGSNAGRGDNAHYQPKPQPQAQPQAQTQPEAKPSGRGRFMLEDGNYLRTTPSEGSPNRHDVTLYSGDHKPQYSVKGAVFGHDEKSGQAEFHSGTETSSGQPMKHTWTGKTMGGNVHQDGAPY